MKADTINAPKTTLQDVARRQMEKTRDVYKISPERMFSEYKGERENVKNYNGRQLLEMLQNADDASMAAVEGNRRVLVRLQENTLIIANTGYPFSEDGLNSIFLSHLSPKDLMERQIGKKGLGFRSILSWAEDVVIKSHDLCVAFSEVHSQAFLEELLKDDQFRSEFNKLNKAGYKLPVATLACPNLDSATVDHFPDIEEFDTIIQIRLNDKAVPDLMKQIEQDIDSEVLLFLNYLESIIIDINGEQSAFTKSYIPGTEKRLIRYSVDGETSEKEWNVHTLSGRFDELDKAYELSIAWQDGLEDYKDVIYTYFRTKVAIKCKGIIHGSFELNADRNLIIKDDLGYNKAVVNLIPTLITGAAEKMAESSITYSYDPLRLVQCELNSLGHLISVNELNQSISLLAKDKAIFPTTSNRFMIWHDEDKPVYYKNKVFCKYLPPSEYPDMLLFAEDPEIFAFLQKLQPGIYQMPDVIESLSTLKDKLPLTHYAKIVLAVHEEVKSTLVHVGSSLLIDVAFNLLTFKQPIYFPNATKYNLPATIGVQVINTELAQELLYVTQSNNYAELAVKLPAFRLREFNFNEVAELLIKHYSTKERPEDIITLHEYLFLLYTTEKPPESTWSGAEVWLLDKKNKKNLARQLYFGKEYNNGLIEEIYSYDKSKLLAAPQRFRITPELSEKWRNYCQWLGVASRPRFVSLIATKEYAEYVMRNFDYNNKIGEYHFKDGYEAFRKELTQGYGQIKVKSIDDLQGILRNNSPEKILQLLSEHTTLLGFLDKDIEPTGDSQIHFGFYNAKTNRSIPHTLMRSYVKWILKFTPWLNTERNKREKPDMCCTAAYVTDDFRGLVEKPAIDYDVLRVNNINRDKVDFLLAVVGVHKGISTFSTAMLYSILLKLPDIDPSGKKTKSIYNQLSANYDQLALDRIDKLDDNNIKFKKEGKVWCQNGSFQLIGQVYYVNDKHYGDTILNQFHTIAVDRRRGKDKIKKIFGVMPLEGINLNMVGTPPLHPLNAMFEQEMQAFKPYVYVLRKEVDGGSEKTVIKDTKFQLVTSLEVELRKDEKDIVLELNDYEYFYQKSRNTAYIKVDKEYTGINGLRDDIFFCAVVAEVFSVMLDVDAQRQQIRELFSKSITSRDELLAAELDDINLQKLAEARILLGIATDPKYDFWRAFCKCLKGRKFSGGLLTDSELLDFLKLRHPTLSEELDATFGGLNYENLNEEISLEHIVSLFRKAKITLPQFNSFFYPSIELNNLYTILFKHERDDRKGRFKELVYFACKGGTKGLDQFLNLVQQYELIQPGTVKDVVFDVQKDLAATVLSKFGIQLDNVLATVDLNVVYNDNLNRFLQYSHPYVADPRLVQRFVDEHPAVQSLLYFGNTNEQLIHQLTIWTGRQQGGGNGGAPKSNRVTLGGKIILYNTLRELLGELSSVVTDDLIGKVKQEVINTERKDINRTGGTGGPTFGGGSRRSRVSDTETGFLGEYLVYRKLLSTAEPGSVVWVSEYAKDCGVNSDGKDGLGYDIRYVPKGQKNPRYVEVKVVGWDDSFNMTSTEVKFAEQYSKHYEMFLVRNLLDLDTLKIEVIRKLFDYGKQSSFTDNDLFTVLNDNFVIKFKKK